MSKVIESVLGDGLQLEPLQDEDLPFTLGWRNRDEARCWFKHAEPLTKAQHQAWFEAYSERDNDMVWMVWADGRRVGQVAAYDIDKISGIAEVGRFLVAPEAVGQGHMSKACRLLIEHCRQRLQLRRLYLEVIPGNERAIRLYRGLGFVVQRESDTMIFMELSL